MNMLLSKKRRLFNCFLIIGGLKNKTLIPTVISILAKKNGLMFYSISSFPPSPPYPSLPFSGIGSVLPTHTAASLIALVQGIRYCAFWCQVQSQVPIYEPVYKKKKKKNRCLKERRSIVNKELKPAPEPCEEAWPAMP